MAAVIITIPTRSSEVAIASCLSTSMYPAVRLRQRRCSTASSCCKKKSGARGQSSDNTPVLSGEKIAKRDVIYDPLFDRRSLRKRHGGGVVSSRGCMSDALNSIGAKALAALPGAIVKVKQAFGELTLIA